MQTVLPFFSENTKLINFSVGFREMDSIVLQYGKPVFCHAKTDHNDYRFSLANLIQNQACVRVSGLRVVQPYRLP